MTPFSLSHLPNDTLLRDLAFLVTQDRGMTARLLVHVGEVEHRRLYRGAGYPSMQKYCVHDLHMSESTAYKRIMAARKAREFPALLPAVAEGRLHLSAVVMLAPHLTARNADELLAAATHRTKAEIECLLAQRFPQPDLPTRVMAISPSLARDESSTLTVVPPVEPIASSPMGPLDPGPTVPFALSTSALSVEPLPTRPEMRTRVAPRSPERYGMQFTVDKETYEQFRYAQALLGHSVPSGDVAQVFRRGMDELVSKLEKQKFAKCARTRPARSAGPGPASPAGAGNTRYVSAEIRRTVMGRDGGKCTFVSSAGKRCGSDTRLELDHIVPIARGGATTTGNLRLLCHAHNQHAADCEFGSDFMRGKRERARDCAAQVQASRAAHAANGPA